MSFGSWIGLVYETGVTNGLQSEINLEMQESFQLIGQDLTAVIREVALASIVANAKNATNVDPTARPSGSPSDSPSDSPSVLASSSPSVFASSTPRVMFS